MTNPNDSSLATFTIDPMHTTVGFAVRHLMVTNVRGAFDHVRGVVRFDPKKPEATQIEAEITVESIHTGEPQRDQHLRSADFFDTKTHPTITFRSKRARSLGEDAIDVTGELTMRGTTREVTLTVRDVAKEQKDHNGKTRLGASATGKLRRSEFGITYNKLLEAGGVAISDEVQLTFDVSLIKDEAR